MACVTAESNAFITHFTDIYLEKLFYFCLKKTGDRYEAEELASDIAMNILAALKKGTVPENFSAWVFKIARNRYSAWAEGKRRVSQSVVGADIGDYEIENGEVSIEDAMIHSEDMALLRRELAFISSEYRNIVVSYYIENASVKTISQTLDIPEGTVKTKLFRARKILKEGMSMAREFGVKSYKPEEVKFAASGNQPSGLPWSAVQRKVTKNILLEASNNPSTIEELSMELGVAAPYMEEEVELLCKATLLRKIGDKYITNFFIGDKECQLDVYHACRRDSKERSRLIDELITDRMPELRALGIVGDHISDNDLKWWLVVYALDYIIDCVDGYDLRWPLVRENGETWEFIGYEDAVIPEKTVLGHNGTPANGSNSHFWAYKFGDYKMWNQVGEIYDGNQTELLAALVTGKKRRDTLSDVERVLWNGIDGRYTHCNENGDVIPDIVVMSVENEQRVKDILASHLNFEVLVQSLTATLDEIVRILKRYSHEVLHETLTYCASMEILKVRMITVHDEVDEGKLTLPEKPKKSKLGMYLIVD